MFDDSGGAGAAGSEWVVPGVDRLREPGPMAPAPGRPAGPPAVSPAVSLSPVVLALRVALDALAAQTPGTDGAQVLADTAALYAAQARLAGVALRWLAELDRHRWHELAGARSTSAWARAQQVPVEPAMITAARRLHSYPLVAAQLQAGTLSPVVAGRLQGALAALRPLLDRPDGLIDGQDGEQVLTGVIGDGVRTLIAQCRGGFPSPTDPQLHALTSQLHDILTGHTAGTGQAARLEAAFVLLAEHVQPAQLPACLAQLVDAVLPAPLADRERDGHHRRGLRLTPDPDGAGWHLTADLDLECGERLHAFLHAELTRDPDQPIDTARARALRDHGLDPYDPATNAHHNTGQHNTGQHGAGQHDTGHDDTDHDGAGHTGATHTAGPRSHRQRAHDAFSTGLARYLDAALGGDHDKSATHLVITVGVGALTGAPGALPARGASGARLPLTLTGRWACDSRLTRQVLNLAGRVIETSHTERTLKAHERRALHTQTGGTCQNAGCARSTRHPGTRLHPHHTDPWHTTGRTSLTDTVLLCDTCHTHLHHHHTLLLKNGRHLGPDGWTT